MFSSYLEDNTIQGNALYLALLEHLVLEASTVVLQHKSRRWGNDLDYAPDSYFSNTKLLHAPLVEPLYPF